MSADLTLTVIIPAYNAASELKQCLLALSGSSVQPNECIVIDDGSTDLTAEVAESFGAQVLSTGGRRGPGYARNLGASKATSTHLLFLDADVRVHQDTVARVIDTFADGTLDAVMGSYDHKPACPRFISTYRNLMHCYTHRSASRNATTFWSGCGGIRREVFLAAGGFDATYGRPAVEDIELGYRLHAAGRRLALDPAIEVQHLKSWDIGSMVRTDVRDRAIPWTLLILRAGRMPNDLNVRWTQRLSVFLVGLALLVATAATLMHGGRFLRPLTAAILLVMGSFWVSEIVVHKSRMVGAALAISLAALFLLQMEDGLQWQILPVLLGYGLLFAREKLSTHGSRRRTVTSFAYGAYLIAGTTWLIAQMPTHPLVLILTSLSAIIVLLNVRFYAFLGLHFGKLYGAAAIPFHIFYQLYSGASFVAATIYYHVWAWRRHRASV
jgi:cellulose synthase/poly-beta-1,6-N-acetylglucosamine synthase-like glycosyltransferase